MGSSKKYVNYVTLSLLISFLFVFFIKLPVIAEELQNGILPGPWGRKVLLFLHTIAKGLGEFFVLAISKVIGEKLSGLVMPLGYMTLLTLVIVIFEFKEKARIWVWRIILIRWVLVIIRVIMEALKVKPVI